MERDPRAAGPESIALQPAQKSPAWWTDRRLYVGLGTALALACQFAPPNFREPCRIINAAISAMSVGGP